MPCSFHFLSQGIWSTGGKADKKTRSMQGYSKRHGMLLINNRQISHSHSRLPSMYISTSSSKSCPIFRHQPSGWWGKSGHLHHVSHPSIYLSSSLHGALQINNRTLLLLLRVEGYSSPISSTHTSNCVAKPASSLCRDSGKSKFRFSLQRTPLIDPPPIARLVRVLSNSACPETPPWEMSQKVTCSPRE
jgi:hypothetical protein